MRVRLLMLVLLFLETFFVYGKIYSQKYFKNSNIYRINVPSTGVNIKSNDQLTRNNLQGNNQLNNVSMKFPLIKESQIVNVRTKFIYNGKPFGVITKQPLIETNTYTTSKMFYSSTRTSQGNLLTISTNRKASITQTLTTYERVNNENNEFEFSLASTSPQYSTTSENNLHSSKFSTSTQTIQVWTTLTSAITINKLTEKFESVENINLNCFESEIETNNKIWPFSNLKISLRVPANTIILQHQTYANSAPTKITNPLTRPSPDGQYQDKIFMFINWPHPPYTPIYYLHTQ